MPPPAKILQKQKIIFKNTQKSPTKRLTLKLKNNNFGMCFDRMNLYANRPVMFAPLNLFYSSRAPCMTNGHTKIEFVLYVPQIVHVSSIN